MVEVVNLEMREKCRLFIVMKEMNTVFYFQMKRG